MKTLPIFFMVIITASCTLGWESGEDASGDPAPDPIDGFEAEEQPPDPGDIPCPDGTLACAGSCVNTRSDHGNCGSCGHACLAAEVCADGGCLFECPEDTIACDGSCVDTATDAGNCGGCGNGCPAGAHAEAVCELGHCAVVCEPGWSDPDGDGSCDENCVPVSATEICNGVDDNCSGDADEGFPCRMGREVGCTTACGSTGSGICGLGCETPSPSSCNPPAELCNGEDDDCNALCDDGAGMSCCRGDTGSCTTSCGSQGAWACDTTCSWGTCQPGPESCNGTDDDCSGVPDDTSGCRVPVYRYLCANDHFYYNGSETPAGCTMEGGGNPAWYNYASAVSGLSFGATELFRLYHGAVNDHFYTISAPERDYAVSIGYVPEGNIGFCSPSSVPGMTTLVYRLSSTFCSDHFYTIDAAEKDAMLATGYADEGIACHAWSSP